MILASYPLPVARSLIFNVTYMMWTVCFGLLCLPAFLHSQQSALAVGRPWANGVLWLADRICGITYEIRGEAYFTHRPVIYASKHQSAWDTVIFLSLLRNPAYILKKELLWLPVFGQYLARMGMIAIDRKSRTATLKSMGKQAARALVKEQRPIVIFPEGTRRAIGAEPRYHPGVAVLYQQLKVPVIPVALNSGLLWGKDAFTKKPGTIILEYLEPIPPGLETRAFLRLLSERIEAATRQLVTNPNPPSED